MGTLNIGISWAILPRIISVDFSGIFVVGDRCVDDVNSDPYRELIYFRISHDSTRMPLFLSLVLSRVAHEKACFTLNERIGRSECL